jgi:hypothetical protein
MATPQLTFDGIKQSLIDMYSAKPEFKDFNFTAPGISSLLDALTYTTLYLVQYANFSLNEVYLDSAQVRSNVVSLAKALGYTPYQYYSAMGKIRVSLKTTAPQTLTVASYVPAETPFIGKTDTGSYTFIAKNDSYFQQGTDGIWYADVEVQEGIYVTETFVEDEYETTKFILSNQNTDTRYMRVSVAENSESTEFVPYTLVTSITDLSSTALVYFLQESYNGNVEIYFGDNKMGKSVVNGNVVKVKYLVTNGSAANTIKTFSLNTSIAGMEYSNFSVSVLEASHSGGDREDIESIRFNSPKYFQRQERNVTVSDYNTSILSNYGGLISSITTWGGEDNTPPQYGKVFVSILPKYSDTISSNQKEEIIQSIKNKSLPCIITEIVDPVIVYMDLTATIDWNQNKSVFTKSVLTDKLSTSILNYFNTNYAGFKTSYKDSKLISLITTTDSSVEDALIGKKLFQNMKAIAGKSNTYVFRFLNKVAEGSVFVGPWMKTGSTKSYYIYDNLGKLYVYDQSVAVPTSIGTVNYETGYIEIQNFDFGISADTTIPVYVTPANMTVDFKQNYIIRPNNIVVTLNNVSTQTVY